MNTSGPPQADVMLIGEAWGKYEDEDPLHHPFIGPSGWELDRMLAEAGFSRAAIFCANVVNHRPLGDKIETLFFNKTQAKKLGRNPVLARYPHDIVLRGMDELYANILRCQPKLIIAAGNTALWALTGLMGITKWRGSMLDETVQDIRGWRPFVVPTIHPAAVLREWPWRQIVVQDFRRAKRVLERGIEKPSWEFTVRPSFAQAKACIDSLHQARQQGRPISCDLETRGGQISCVGIATAATVAFSIPFMSLERPEGYWSESEELEIIYRLKAALQGPGGAIVFQNGAYDLQYFAKQFGWIPYLTDDTMLMQHLLFPGLRKGLDFLSSLYCEYHRYWKDDGKLWDPRIHSEEQHWRYNCEDCVRTLEVFEVLSDVVDSSNLRAQYLFQIRLLKAMLKTMLRGTRIDVPAKKAMERELSERLGMVRQWINTALGRDFNCNSHPQMVSLFYDEMGLAPIKKRDGKEWRVTCDNAALEKIKKKAPILAPLCEKMQEQQSYEVFLENYAKMRIPPDLRVRASVNLAGTRTFRFSYSEDAFGFGGNLQTIPKGTED